MSKEEQLRKIFKAYCNPTSRTILEAANTPMVLFHLQKKCGLPTTTFYRYIKPLIKEKLLIHNGEIMGKNGHFFPTYVCPTRKVTIEFTNGQTRLKVQSDPEYAKNYESVIFSFS